MTTTAGQIFGGVEGFLGHSTSVSSGAYLKNWKEDDQIDVVLHPGGSIAASWRHRWFRIYEDKEGKSAIGSLFFNSMEPEKVLLKQHFRNDDGSREFPPTVCPFSLLLEWVREQVDNNVIGWTDEIFFYESKKEDVSILAGGFTGLFNQKNLTDDQLDELKKAKVNRKEAFKQKGAAALNYIFQVVQYEFPDEGCMVAIEGKALGEKMKSAIRREINRYVGTKTPDAGNPFKHPFVFRWKYDDSESFDDKYDVDVMTNEQMPITPAVQAVLDEEAPSIEKLISPSNVAVLRHNFEDHWVHSVVPPWDEIFAPALDAVKGTGLDKLPAESDAEVSAGDKKPAQGKRENVEVTQKLDPALKDMPGVSEEEEFACDDCGSPMKASEDTCKKCGAKYDLTTGMKIEKPKEEPKPAPRSRSAAAASKSDASEKTVEPKSPKRRGGD